MGLDVKVEHFGMWNGSTWDALAELNNDCGLIFGCADSNPSVGRHRFTLDLHNKTVKQIVDEVARLSPDYSFKTYDGVVLVATAGADDTISRLLKLKVDAFKTDALGEGDLTGLVSKLLATLPGHPEFMPMPNVSAVRPGPDPRTPVKLNMRGETLEAILLKAARLLNESWFLGYAWDDKGVTFDMGQGCGYDAGGEYNVTLAPGAPRKPILDEPPPDYVWQVAEGILKRAKSPTRHPAATVRELTALIEDGWVRGWWEREAAEALRLLGDLGIADGAPVLVANITREGNTEYRSFGKDWASQYRKSNPSVPPPTVKMVRDAWFSQFPALAALTKMGSPAVPALVQGVADADLRPPVGQTDNVWSAAWRQAQVILLCQALDQILGTDAAVTRLRDAAATEKDPARAQRLTAAADRIAQGLLLTAD
jgi:hypothetical protein